MTQVQPRPKAKKRKRDYSKQADKLCGAIVRARGVCEAGYDHDGPSKCSGPLQWAHGFSRSYRAVRWDLGNGFCLCAGHHFYFTNHPLEWDDWLREKWGDEGYTEMRCHALRGLKPDLRSLVELLKEQA